MRTFKEQNKFQLIIIDNQTGETLVDSEVSAVCGSALTSVNKDGDFKLQELGLTACPAASILAVSASAKKNADRLVTKLIDDMAGKSEMATSLSDKLMEIVASAMEEQDNDNE